ncbi:DNA/RNA helicase domain-containing protein [Yinghuangia aomiensis]
MIATSVCVSVLWALDVARIALIERPAGLLRPVTRTCPHPRLGIRRDGGQVHLDRISAADLVGRIGGPAYLQALADTAAAQHPNHKRPTDSQIEAWRVGLTALADDLVAIDRHSVEVFVEYTLPGAGVEVDALLAGRHPETGDPSYVVVELKRWEQVTVDPKEAHRCRAGDRPDGKTKPNSVYQVREYCGQLLLRHAAVAGHVERLAGIAYLHDAKAENVRGLALLQPNKNGLLFTADTRPALRTVLAARFAAAKAVSGEHAKSAGDLWESVQLGTRVAVTRTVREEMCGQPQFHLVGNQVEAYHATLAAVEARHATGVKQIVIVTGGPGTGKSAIATRLLAELRERGHDTELVVPSSAYRNVVAAAAPRGTKYLMRSPGAYRKAESDGIDVLICDEAHRIQRTSSGMFDTNAMRAAARPQIDELIDAAKVAVFLLDRHQTVRPGDVGSVDSIRAAARRRGAVVAPAVDLDGAFRCGGSRRYLDWVHNLFELEPEAVGKVWEPDDLMDVRTAQDMYQMTAYLRDKVAAGESARIAAGYAWQWRQANDDGTLPMDIVLDDGWQYPWNARSESTRDGVPSRSKWAVEAGGFEQVGCIYTAQGLEYDWAGVLLGLDLVRRGDAWTAQPKESHDKAARRGADADGGAVFDRCVRNAYKVLSTRGMRGVVFYSVDPETQAYLEQMVNGGLARDYSKGPTAKRFGAPRGR